MAAEELLVRLVDFHLFHEQHLLLQLPLVEVHPEGLLVVQGVPQLHHLASILVPEAVVERDLIMAAVEVAAVLQPRKLQVAMERQLRIIMVVQAELVKGPVAAVQMMLMPRHQ